MRILHLADIHIDLVATRLGKWKIVNGVNVIYTERLERFRKIIQHGVNLKVDMIVISGDLFNRSKPFPQELWDVASILDSIPISIPTFIIPGNHDEKTSRGCALQPLQDRRPHVRIILEPTIFDINSNPRKHYVFAPWGTSLNELHEIRKKLIYPEPILITHLGTTLEGKHWTEIAGEVGNINLSDLKALNFQAVLLGHYHGQTNLGQNIWYSGSPECYNFGEAEQVKGYLLWDFDEINKTVVAHSWQIQDGPLFKTFTVEEFLDYKEPGFSGNVKVQGEATEEQKAVIIERLQTFQCDDYKLDLQSTLKVKRTFALKGKSNIEVLTNYLESKNIGAEAIPGLIELDQDIEEYVRL